MPKDLKMIWDTDLMEGDLEVNYGDFTTDEGLETAVTMSLFTDRRARDDDILLDSDFADKRGWWGDLISPDVEGDEIGSRLWLLYRAKTTEQALIEAKEYAIESLEWMKDDEAVSDVIIETERIGEKTNEWLALLVKIVKGDANVLNLRYEVQWTAQLEG